MKEYIVYIIRFVLLVLFQTLVLNNINLFGYINPSVYLLFLLLLPFEMPYWSVILLGFVLGFSVDMFALTYGLHAAATTFVAFCRPFVVKSFVKRQDYESASQVLPEKIDFNVFLVYVIIMLLLHQFVFFMLDACSVVNFFSLLGRVLLSTVISAIFILIVKYIFYNKTKNRAVR